MAQFNETISSNLALVTGALALATVLLLLLAAIQAWRLRRLGRRLDKLTRGASGHDLAGVLEAHLDTVLRVAGDVDALADRTKALEANERLAFRRIGLHRYNPFQDTGGNQSFALALLDAEDTGFVMSSLHSRAGTRVYAKAITAGRCDTALSEEENQALEAARRGRAPKVAPAKGSERAASVAAAVRVPAEPPARGWRSDPTRATLDSEALDRRLRGAPAEAGGNGSDGAASIWGDTPRS